MAAATLGEHCPVLRTCPLSRHLFLLKCPDPPPSVSAQRLGTPQSAGETYIGILLLGITGMGSCQLWSRQGLSQIVEMYYFHASVGHYHSSLNLACQC